MALPYIALTVMASEHFLNILHRVTIHTNQSKRTLRQTLYERPLVRVHGPARRSPIAPKIKHDHASAIVA